MSEESRSKAGPHIRPQSQASTHSATDTASAPASPRKISGDAASLHSQQIGYHHQHVLPQNHFSHTGHQLSQEEALMLQAAYHLQGHQNLNNGVHVNGDNRQQLAPHVPMNYHQQNHADGSNMMDKHFQGADGTPTFSASHTFNPNGSVGPDDEGQSFLTNASNISGSGTRASRSSANNELDMRQLFQQNKSRTLDSVASDLHGNERGPNSERMRQLFAMLWISRHCTVGKTSVPRGRVYANYASRCAGERVCVLNPASFGKLVRVLFQGLKTRRLGVRGESRYHYVNFGLIDDVCEGQDQENIPPSPKTKRSRSQESSKTLAPPPALESQKSHEASQSHLPSPRVRKAATEYDGPAPKRRRSDTFGVYNCASICDQDPSIVAADRTMTRIYHGFESEDLDPSNDQGLFVLPSMEPFLPKHADREAAHTLAALYRSHCTSLSECVRFCRTDAFFHNYKAFHGTLTMPVQKILHLPEMAPWISHCDTILYQRIIRIISNLALQAIPMPVLTMLRTIAQKLVPNLRDYNHAQPKHVVAAREAPAAIFAHLVGRAIRVNLTAHVAHNVLRSTRTRNVMWKDFVQTVQVRGVASSVPSASANTVLDILSQDIQDLIRPTKSIEDVAEGEEPAQIGEIDDEDDEYAADDSSQTLILKWDIFITDLRHRFPSATARQLMMLGDRISSAITRDIIIGGGKSFMAWSVIKSWFDEMLAFKAEYGGFLGQENIVPDEVENRRPTSLAQLEQVEPENRGSKEATAEPCVSDQDKDLDSGTQPTRAPFPPLSIKPTASATTTKEAQANKTVQETTTPEDSGIGIRTPEYEAMMDKYTLERYTFDGDDTLLNADDDSVMVGH